MRRSGLLAAAVTPGQAHESKSFEDLVGGMRLHGRRGRPRCRPVKLAGDKGYSYRGSAARWLATGSRR